MKKTFSVNFLLLIVLLVLLHSCNKTNSLNINGNIQNLTDPEILVSYYIGDSLKIDTLLAKSNSKFQYKNSVDSLTLFSFYFNNQSSSAVSIFLSLKKYLVDTTSYPVVGNILVDMVETA